jgi:sulfate transport system substrate-binding protein
MEMQPGARGRTVARWGAILAAAVVAGMLLHALWSSRGAAGGGKPCTIVAYGAVSLEDVFARGVFPAFEEEWRRRTGEEVRFAAAFNPLGTVTDALLKGAPADVALLSADPQLAGLDPGESSRALPHGGVFSRTPIVIVVRPGNPSAVTGFEDLARPGLGVVQPDPLVSGIGQWVIFAEYGSILRRSSDPRAAAGFLLDVARNLAARAASPLEARSLFENGVGDVLVTSEHEALRGASAGAVGLEIVYPRATILSEPTLVIIERNVDPAEREAVDALASFIWSGAGQDIFVRFGFRSAAARVETSSHGRIEEPFLIGDLGGWKSARREIIDGVWRNRILKEVRR